jgi:hypothetical protein
MLWWIGTALVWLISATWITFILADVFRGKSSALASKNFPGYAIHGATAVLALWMVTKALGAWPSSPSLDAVSVGPGRPQSRSRPLSEDQEMKGVLRVSGYLLLLFGLIWIVAITGGVFSRGDGFNNVLDLIPAFAIHTACMLGGLALASRGAAKKPAQAAQSVTA